MSNLPVQYQSLPGYNTIYSEAELRQAIALAQVFLLLNVGGASSFATSVSQVQNSPDLIKVFTYVDTGTPDERIISIQYKSPSLNSSFTETYAYAGTPGSYRVNSFTRSQP